MHPVGWVRPHARAGGPRETQVDRRPCWLPARSGLYVGDDSDLGTDLGALPRPQLETRNLDPPRIARRTQELGIRPPEVIIGRVASARRGRLRRSSPPSVRICEEVPPPRR